VEADVFLGGKIGVETGVLEDNADFLSNSRALSVYVQPGYFDKARGFGQGGGENGNSSGFPGSVGAEKRKEFTTADGKADIVY